MVFSGNFLRSDHVVLLSKNTFLETNENEEAVSREINDVAINFIMWFQHKTNVGLKLGA